MPVSKIIIVLLWMASVTFFVLGLTHPILETGLGFLYGLVTINHEYIYLSGAFRYFFEKGEVFIGLLLLLFTIIMPILKYVFLLLAIFNVRFKTQKAFMIVLDVVNKWSMLDVFVVALLILNMKFGSKVIISNLANGATYFAVSVVLLMACSFFIKYTLIKKDNEGDEKKTPGRNPGMIY